MDPVGDIDLKAAVNAISDVIMNRPRPLREFDQIYMKAGDMVMQAEHIARWSDGRRLIFIGDGDAISVCVAYLQARQILPYGPLETLVLDFDERVVSAIERFADKERIPNLRAKLYNCIEPLPSLPVYDLFYTNPPWGASNAGASVNLFAYRGMEATRFGGEGVVVIADDDELEWPQRVLGSVQKFAYEQGHFVRRMTPRLHSYHLDDAPDLKSCNLVLRAIPGFESARKKPAIDDEFLTNFYGAGLSPRVRYVREMKRLDYGKAHDDEYSLELIDD